MNKFKDKLKAALERMKRIKAGTLLCCVWAGMLWYWVIFFAALMIETLTETPTLEMYWAMVLILACLWFSYAMILYLTLLTTGEE